jgi:phenylalanyl-tRNA synthetase beta chain
VIPDTLEAQKAVELALKVGAPLVQSAKIFDRYRGAQVEPGHVSIAVKVTFTASEKNLEEKDVEELSRRIVEAWEKHLSARLRGT